MKKLKSICVIMALACMTTAWAQRDITFDRELSVGVKGGVTIPNMAFSPSIQQNTWVGYTTGLTFRYIEENIFGLIAELNFTQRGSDGNGSGCRKVSAAGGRKCTGIYQRIR